MELGIATGWKSLEGQDRKRPDCLETIGKKKKKLFQVTLVRVREES